MMNDYFKRLYTYNMWANDKLLTLLEQHKVTDQEVLVATSHYLAAMEIWVSRIQGRPARVNGVWEVYDYPRCREVAQLAGEDWLAMIPTLTEADYHRRIAYKNTQGDYYETPVIDIMGHAINHATYHRAQIARMLRLAGIKPINTDFITYARLHDLGV
jgi:uncharacterized damage-inducible protein DinB